MKTLKKLNTEIVGFDKSLALVHIDTDGSVTVRDVDRSYTSTLADVTVSEPVDLTIADFRVVAKTFNGHGVESIVRSDDRDSVVFQSGNIRKSVDFNRAAHLSYSVDKPVDYFAITLDVKRARALVDKLLAHCAQNDVRYYLHGAYFVRESDGGLYAVATDGHRLTRERIASDVPDTLRNTIVPRQVLDTWRKTLVGCKSDVELVLPCGDDTTALINSGGTIVTGRSIDGRYPDYARVMPCADRDGAPLQITIDRQVVLSVVQDIVAIHRAQRSEYPTLVMTGYRESDSVAFDVLHNGESVYHADIDVGYDAPTGDKSRRFEIGLNAYYMLDALKNARANSLTIDVRGASNSVVLHSYRDGDYFLIMPVRL